MTYDDPSTLLYVSGDTPTASGNTGSEIAVASGSYNLGSFTVVSPYAQVDGNFLRYDGSTYKNTNATAQNNNGFVVGPTVITAVPEPASLAVLGIGVLGMGFVRRRGAA